MKLSNDELKKIYFGAYEFEETDDGYLQAFQHTKSQMSYLEDIDDFLYVRSFASTSKTLEFKTDAAKVSFDYKIIWKGSEDSFELMVDGLISKIVYVKDLSDEGTLEFDLPEGTHDIVIYLAADATVLIRNFDIDSSYEIPKKSCKVLWIGDSITQGYGPLRSAETYVSIANRLLGYDIINQGIGAYYYDKNILEKMPGYDPDKIIVSLGTNQYGCGNMTGIEEYYEKLIGIYGTDIPILCITPIWRGDHLEEIDVLMSFCEKLKSIVSKYPNIKIVDGMTLVPHLFEYFLDGLHPNCLGTECYGRNLVEEIRKIGF